MAQRDGQMKGFAAVREWPAHKWLRRHVTRVVVPLLLSPRKSSHRQAPGAWDDLQFCLQFRCKSNSDGSGSVSIQLKKLNLILVLFLLSLREDVFHSLGSERKHPHTMPLEALVTCGWETNRNLDCSPHPSPNRTLSSFCTGYWVGWLFGSNIFPWHWLILMSSPELTVAWN